MKNLMKRISVDPKICFGKPCIRGTRIPLYLIVELVEEGFSPKKIIEQCYPDLTVEDIKACLHYAAAVLQNDTEEMALLESR